MRRMALANVLIVGANGLGVEAGAHLPVQSRLAVLTGCRGAV